MYLKGEGDKLSHLSEAMSFIRLFAVFTCILLMMLLAGD